MCPCAPPPPPHPPTHTHTPPPTPPPPHPPSPTSTPTPTATDPTPDPTAPPPPFPSAGARRWSPLARWRLREFNELPHFVSHRCLLSTDVFFWSLYSVLCTASCVVCRVLCPPTSSATAACCWPCLSCAALRLASASGLVFLCCACICFFVVPGATPLPLRWANWTSGAHSTPLPPSPLHTPLPTHHLRRREAEHQPAPPAPPPTLHTLHCPRRLSASQAAAGLYLQQFPNHLLRCVSVCVLVGWGHLLRSSGVAVCAGGVWWGGGGGAAPLPAAPGSSSNNPCAHPHPTPGLSLKRHLASSQWHATWSVGGPAPPPNPTHPVATPLTPPFGRPALLALFLPSDPFICCLSASPRLPTRTSLALHPGRSVCVLCRQFNPTHTPSPPPSTSRPPPHPHPPALQPDRPVRVLCGRLLCRGAAGADAGGRAAAGEGPLRPPGRLVSGRQARSEWAQPGGGAAAVAEACRAPGRLATWRQPGGSDVGGVGRTGHQGGWAAQVAASPLISRTLPPTLVLLPAPRPPPLPPRPPSPLPPCPQTPPPLPPDLAPPPSPHPTPPLPHP